MHPRITKSPARLGGLAVLAVLSLIFSSTGNAATAAPTDTRLETLAHELETSGILQNPQATSFTQQATGYIRQGNLPNFIDLLDSLQKSTGLPTFLSPDAITHFRDEAETLRFQLVKEKHVQARQLQIEAHDTFNKAQKPEDLDALLLKLPPLTTEYGNSKGDELNNRDAQSLNSLRTFAEHYRFFLGLIHANDQSRMSGSYRELSQENKATFYVDASHLDKLFADASTPASLPLGPQVDAIVDKLVANGDYDKAQADLYALRTQLQPNRIDVIQDLTTEISGYSSFLLTGIPYARLENLTHFIDACHCEAHFSAWTPKLQPLYRQLIGKFILVNTKLEDYPAIDASHETVVAYLHRMLDQARAEKEWDDANQFLLFLFIYGDNFHTKMSYFQQQDTLSFGYYKDAIDRLGQNRYAEALEKAYLSLLNARTYGPEREATALFQKIQKDHPDDYALVAPVLRYQRMMTMKTQAADMRDQWAYLVPTP